MKKEKSMKTTIFYFSATGNSLSLTRSLANELGNCEIVSIAKAIRNETIEVTTPKIGLVFPVFAWGLPRIVTEFVNKLTFKEKPYIFAITTCVAIPGNTLKELQKLLWHKGADLNAGFVVRAGRSSLMKLNSLDKIIIRIDRQRKKLKNGEARLTELVTVIKNLELHRPETSSWSANLFGSMFHNLALRSFKSIDSTFVIKDSCTGCGNCSRLCPRSNIVIENNLPTFLHNCELCHACIQWCPNFAIQHPNFDATLKQYHNPAIQMKDLILA
jgi:ferredoxin